MPRPEGKRLKRGPLTLDHHLITVEDELRDGDPEREERAPPDPAGQLSSMQQCASKKAGQSSVITITLMPQLIQTRPSVLCQTSQVPPQDHPQRSDGILACDLQPVNLSRVNSVGSAALSTGQARNSLNPRYHGRPLWPVADPSSPLYLNGLCLWPGCDETFADYSHFLQHLDNDHNYGDKAFAQWKVQQDMVQHLENQLILEKEKLHAMQLHLNLASLITTSKVAGSDLIGSLAVSAGRAEGTYGDPLNASEEPGVPVQQKLWNIPHAHLLPDIMSDIELYKHTDIRPPYTYASLIRWSILEAPDKQQTLNEIYNWFTRMFYYFRHNNAAWKNAVRHNLSLHKCFVRVEGAKGAVWTVDEVEFQRRKKQKFNRDYTVRWLTPYSRLPHGPCL